MEDKVLNILPINTIGGKLNEIRLCLCWPYFKMAQAVGTSEYNIARLISLGDSQIEEYLLSKIYYFAKGLYEEEKRRNKPYTGQLAKELKEMVVNEIFHI